MPAVIAANSIEPSVVACVKPKRFVLTKAAIDTGAIDSVIPPGWHNATIAAIDRGRL